MSTSLLYHSFGIREVTYKNTKYLKGETIFEVDPKPILFKCSLCHSRDVVKNGCRIRQIKLPPIGRKKSSIKVKIHTLKCAFCKTVRAMKLPFVDGKNSYSASFERYIYDLSVRMTIKDTADFLGIDWHLVKNIQKKYLKRNLLPISLKGLNNIAIDEISIGKGHNYLTVVMDLESGAIVFIGDGKGSDALIPFWMKLKRSGAQIRAVAIDMSPAYTKAVKDNLGISVIVYDHFHIIKLYNEKMSNLRRTLFNSNISDESRSVLKGSRWLILKLHKNLNKDKDELTRLEEALKLNEPLAKAYYMRDELEDIWHKKGKINAMAAIADWVIEARNSGVNMLKKFANTLLDHWKGIVNYYDFPISTGPLEGTNNKIKTLQKMAYGHRDIDYFKLKIFSMHKMKHKLVG
jgi:transposase